MLQTCLDRVAAQTRPPDHVLVVDNASSDETPQVLAERSGVEALRTGSNLGGAGGFAHGLRAALERDCDWIWILDDDAWPEPECLHELLSGIGRAPEPPDLMTSAVRWRDGRLHPMNRPWFRHNRRGDFALAAGAGLVLVRAATSVSTMVRRDALVRHGFHPEHYVVWIDDIEWTGRILREGIGYLVPESECVHMTAEAKGTIEDARERFYFKARNQLWLLRAGRSFGGSERLFYAVAYVSAIRHYVRTSDSRVRAIKTVARGVRDGMRREPK